MRMRASVCGTALAPRPRSRCRTREPNEGPSASSGSTDAVLLIGGGMRSTRSSRSDSVMPAIAAATVTGAAAKTKRRSDDGAASGHLRVRGRIDRAGVATRDPEVEHLHDAVVADEHVLRLD